MSERDPVQLLEAQLTGMEELTDLHADHEIFKHWAAETKTILEKAFGTRSIHYQNFLALRFREMSVKPFASPEIDRIDAARYKRDLESGKNTLKAAIKELNLDRTFFKKMQTTPKTVEIALKGEYFVSFGTSGPGLINAIESAFDGSGLTPVQDTQGGHPGGILFQRIDQIRRSKFGIYNLSVPDRTDILLELGAALGLGRDVTIVCEKGASIPETIKSLERIEFENLPELTEKLKKRIRR